MLFNSHSGFLVPADDEAKDLLKLRDRKSVELKEVGHSEPQHRAFFSYLKWDWKNNFKDKMTFDLYRERLSIAVGHVEVFKRKVSKETVYKMLEDLNKAKESEKYAIDYELPASMSFGKADNAAFNNLVQKVEDLIFERTGVSMADHIEKAKQFQEA